MAQARKQGRIPEVKSYDFDGGESFFWQPNSAASQVAGVSKSAKHLSWRIPQDFSVMPFFTARFTTFWPGDGVVGQLDYFIGKCFDQDADGRLTTGERRRAEKAIPDQKGSSG